MYPGDYGYGYSTVTDDGYIKVHLGWNRNAPKAPSWLGNKYVQGAAKLVAGHEIQNMADALKTYEEEGFKAYIQHSIGNAIRENSFAYAAGGYGPARGGAGGLGVRRRERKNYLSRYITLQLIRTKHLLQEWRKLPMSSG